jgi:ferrous iron transport protein B
VYEQGKAFCTSAGTMIFAVAIVIWALGYYPHPASIAAEHEAQRAAARAVSDGERVAQIDQEEAGAYLRQSILGRMGLWIEPAVRPLGWDWRIGTAAIASFPAREVVVATLGTIYNLGANHDEDSAGLRATLQAATWPDGRPVFNLAVALSLMVFFALCCQCGATLATIRRETGSWRWPILTFSYMTVLAYVCALFTYRLALPWI